jgi:hypothetical protein
MPFGNNSLVLTYSPGQEGEEVEMRFNGLDALAEVGVGEGWEDRTGGAVLVSMAETWGKNRSVQISTEDGEGFVLMARTQPSQLLSDTPLPARPVKPHDWTYSTCHTGSIAGPSVCLDKIRADGRHSNHQQPTRYLSNSSLDKIQSWIRSYITQMSHYSKMSYMIMENRSLMLVSYVFLFQHTSADS